MAEAKKTKAMTNDPAIYNNAPTEWDYMPEISEPNMGKENPMFAPGATEETQSLPGNQAGDPEDMTNQPATMPADPRLGMNTQGGWDTDKMQKMFPEMFVREEEWLDPAEEAKRREGMPYDATKKYDPNKPVAGVGGGIQGGRVPPMRPSRDEFEKIVLQQIGGNPFGMNPYDAVIQADKNLPALFNHVFQGRAIYQDLPKLDDEERKYWEQVKKQYHERAYKEAEGKKKAMMEQYKNLMGKYDFDTKAQQAEFAKQEKERIRQETIRNKAPQMRAAYNDAGVQTVHMFYPDGRIVDTGKRTGMYALEDSMPPNVKAAQQLINKFSPQANPMMMMMITMMKEKDPKTASMFEQMLNPQAPAEMKAPLAAAKQLVDSYWKEFAKRFGGAGGAQAPQAPAAPGQSPAPVQAPGAAAPKPAAAGAKPANTEHIIAKIVQGVSSGKSMDKSIQAFSRQYANDPKALQRLKTSLEAAGAPLPDNYLWESSGQQGVPENKRVKK